jgi:hypothetical protein
VVSLVAFPANFKFVSRRVVLNSAVIINICLSYSQIFL